MKLKKHSFIPKEAKTIDKADKINSKSEQPGIKLRQSRSMQINKADNTGNANSTGNANNTDKGNIGQSNSKGNGNKANKVKKYGNATKTRKDTHPVRSKNRDLGHRMLETSKTAALRLLLYLRDMSRKRKILSITGAVSFVIFLIFTGIIASLISHDASQQMAVRWGGGKDVSQVSSFFAREAQVSQDTLENFRHSIDDALQANSIKEESTNPGARLWTDAYSATGKLTVKSDRGSVDAEAIGIGGDFFQFHPEQLLYGAYFSGNDVLKDYCILDEDGAWQLFGSSDVAGQMVTISGIPHVVTGVIRRPAGKLYEEAGLDTTIVYVSYETLHDLGTDYGINHYEIVMPNPVSSFAANYIRDNIGVPEEDMEVVENSTRYDLLKRLELITKFGSRSMNGKGIIYPFWENVARGYEDITALLTFISLLFLGYSLVLAIIGVILAWKHKRWTLKSMYSKIKDKWERRREKSWAKKQNKKVKKSVHVRRS
jgi:hypothetical protein